MVTASLPLNPILAQSNVHSQSIEDSMEYVGNEPVFSQYVPHEEQADEIAASVELFDEESVSIMSATVADFEWVVNPDGNSVTITGCKYEDDDRYYSSI